DIRPLSLFLLPNQCYRWLMNRLSIIFAILFVGFQCAAAQSMSKYWVYLQAKDAPVCAVDSRACHLLPPDSITVDEIIKTGAKISVRSSWLNAVSVVADSIQLSRISNLDNISSIEPVHAMKSTIAHTHFGTIS